MIHDIYCAFYCYYISSTSDHQALDPGGWGLLFQMMPDVVTEQNPMRPSQNRPPPMSSTCLLSVEKLCCVQSLSRVQFFVTPWTIACQNPLSKGFFRQEYWSGLPGPSPGDLPSPGIEPRSPALLVGSLPSEPPEKPKNTGMCSLFLSQGIFLSQESNQSFFTAFLN